MTLRIAMRTIALAAFLTLPPAVPVQARVEGATVVVEGMSCPFCAFGVEKRLKKVGGVGSIEIDMGLGSASLTAADRGSIDVAAIPEAIRKAGFTSGTIEVTAVGTISIEDDGRVFLEISGTDQALLLVSLSEEIERKSGESAAAGVRLRVSGELRFLPEDLAGLEPAKMEAIE